MTSTDTADPPADLPYAEVIGDPIAHSKSPLIHNFWLEKLGMVMPGGGKVFICISYECPKQLFGNIN